MDRSTRFTSWVKIYPFGDSEDIDCYQHTFTGIYTPKRKRWIKDWCERNTRKSYCNCDYNCGHIHSIYAGYTVINNVHVIRITIYKRPFTFDLLLKHPGCKKSSSYRW